MKHGWPLRKVGELFDVQLGKMLSPKARKGKLFPYLANFNVQWGKFNLENIKLMHFTESEQEKYSLKQGDILMCEGGEVGRCAIWNARSTNFYYQKALHRLRPKDKNRINPYFMCVYMEHVTSNKGLTKIVGETSIAHLTREKLCALQIPCPSKEQQDKIVNTISTWDAAIDKTERLIAAKEKQFKWLLKRLISDQQDNPEWRKVKLGDICRILKGQGLSKDNIGEDGKNKCILYGQLYTVYPEVVSKVISCTNADNGASSEKGDVLIPGSTTTQGIDLANSTALLESGVLLGGDINILRAVKDNLYDSSFFAYYLTHSKKREILRYTQGTTIVHLYGKDLKNLDISLPEMKKQKQIVEALNVARREIGIFKQVAEQYRTQKHGLMQKLLTGDWRILC